MAEVQLSKPIPPTSAASKTDSPNDAQRDIAELFRVPERYLRSIHLERDFDDTTSLLEHYVITPPTVALFSRILEGLRPGSGHRAWRVTGDYGTGKSSFALILAHLLRDPTLPTLASIRQAIERETKLGVFEMVHMVPVLVTGAREPFVPAVARAVGCALERLHGRGHNNRTVRDLQAQAASVAMSANPSQLLDLLDGVAHSGVGSGYSGVLLVLDELGKFLEYAALCPDQEDVYVLQRLAEHAGRSNDSPLVVLGLLHQGFHAYAENLPSTTRLEWEKVAGRYEEITFDQPLAHVSALVAGALNIDQTVVPKDVADAASHVRAATLETVWYGASGSTLSPLELYPLHPTLLPVLVRFFARFGQHERSLFSFLLSSEPFGLQSFAERPANGHTWYRLADFYDYIRSTFGHRLAGASYRSHWLRIIETIDRMAEMEALELSILKTVAVLNLLDAEHLLANRAVLEAALTDGGVTGAVRQAVASLKRRGLLFDRGVAGGYCLWPSTSINLESAFEAAKRVIGPVDRVSAYLRPYLDEGPVLARRHYIETGTLRHFEVRYADPASLLDTFERATDADGLVIVILCDTLIERDVALAGTMACELAERPEVIVAVPPPIQGVGGEALDALAWQWVLDNTQELAQDSYATAEVSRQVSTSRRRLLRSLSTLFGIRGKSLSEVVWRHQGRRIDPPEKGGVSAILSNICDELYQDAPLIRNELLNRRTLSSAASAARLRLIERLFSGTDRPSLGMETGKAPPEKSMYLSVLQSGNVHREEAGGFVLTEPPEGADPLHLRPALGQILVMIEQANGRCVPVTEILDALQSRPFGVREGVAPLLLAITLVSHDHEIAVYEDGTFMQQFDSPGFLRLMKRPSVFDLQLCRVIGVRAEIFSLLARVFAGEHPSNGRDHELLDVVRPLSTFAAQLPEYTRRSSTLPNPAKDVRDALVTAREPATLIFETLPIACGHDPFPLYGVADVSLAGRFVDVLRDAMASLRAAYPQLLERIRRQIALGLTDEKVCPERPQVAQRASRVLVAVREPRLQTFARCLADAALSDDSWAERVGSFVVSKPPAQWTAADEARAIYEIELLSALFCRVEATAFSSGEYDPQANAVRLGLTNSDGSEVARVVRIRDEDEADVQEWTAKLEQVLGEVTTFKLAAISRVLWNGLNGDSLGRPPISSSDHLGLNDLPEGAS